MTTTYTATLPRAQAEALAAAIEPGLEELGVAHTLFEVSDGASEWRVAVYAEPDADGAAARVLSDAAPLVAFERAELADEDWVTRSLTALAPVRAGGFVVHGSHDRGVARTGETAVEIDAARAFGTGHHGTTAGCLVALDRLLRRGTPRRVLDLGTGSGVLAIAVARRARVPVLATDIDPVAVAIARDNARLNGVGSLVRATVARGLAHRSIRAGAPYDLIVANILAGPLRAMAPAIARHLAPGGRVVLSGLLEHQRAGVVAACRAQGLRLEATLLRERWATLTLAG